MSLLISQHPAQLHYSRDETWISFLSDGQGPPSPANFILFVRAGSTAGDTLTFTWGGTEVVCTTAAAPAANGLSIPTLAGGQTLAEYADAILQAFFRNAFITQDFDIERTSPNGLEYLIFRAKTTSIVDLDVVSSNASALEVRSLSNPNLNSPVVSAVIEAHALQGNSRETLGRRSAPITESFSAFFDVASSISLEAITPPAGLLNVGFAIGQIFGNVMRYEIRYGIQIGTPPSPLALEQYISTSGNLDIIAVHGRTPSFGYNPILAQGGADGAYVLHAIVEREEVLPEQPVFRYIAATKDVIPFTGAWSIDVATYRAGVETITNHTLAFVEMKRGGSYVIPVGFYQLGLDLLPNPEEISHYTVTLKTTKPVALLGTFMVKHECPDYRATILFDNQLGGCDTMVLEGDQRWSNPTTVNPVRSPATPNSPDNFSEGSRTGDHIVEGNSGYVSKTRAQHISTALPARAWILSGANWLPGYLEKTDDTYLDTSTNLASVPIRFTLAAPQR